MSLVTTHRICTLVVLPHSYIKMLSISPSAEFFPGISHLNETHSSFPKEVSAENSLNLYMFKAFSTTFILKKYLT